LNRLNGLNIFNNEREPNNRIIFNQRFNINNVCKEAVGEAYLNGIMQEYTEGIHVNANTVFSVI